MLIQSETLTASDPAFKAAVQDVIAGVSKLDAVAKVESPLDAENTGQISDDRHSVLVPLEIRGSSDDAADKIDPVVARVAEVQKAHPELYIGSFGESTGKAVKTAFFDDLKKAGLFSVPLTLIILLVAFGALVAAGIPLLLGADGGARDAGPGRAHQPGAPDGRRRGGDHPSDRARRRRRLHDVLLEART